MKILQYCIFFALSWSILVDAHAMQINIGKKVGMYLAGDTIEIYIDYYKIVTLAEEDCAKIEFPEQSTYLWVRMNGPIDYPTYESDRLSASELPKESFYFWKFKGGYDWAHWSLDQVTREEFEAKYPSGECDTIKASAPNKPNAWKPSLLQDPEYFLRNW